MGGCCGWDTRDGLWWLWGVRGLTVCPPAAGSPLPEGLSRLFGVLGELEGCHRLAQPPDPPAPALLQLQV